METETLDKLFLELSQFTKAKTQRHLQLERGIGEALRHLRDATRNGPVIRAIAILEETLGPKEERA